jgi:NADH:ubiquinone oxidoreductase subunit 4 (subunit M)
VYFRLSVGAGTAHNRHRAGSIPASLPMLSPVVNVIITLVIFLLFYRFSSKKQLNFSVFSYHSVSYIRYVLLLTPIVLITYYLFVFYMQDTYLHPFLYQTTPAYLGPLHPSTSFSEPVLYAFPYVFIFVFVTLISLVYCFCYNYNELLSFYTYINLIFISGIVFFSTTSLVVFFLAYEGFLIPSFLILYNYAKTRKSVEAAFLMFFWTQFGALSLIFNFTYLFFLNSTWGMSAVTDVSISPSELLFLQTTLFIGFGVKFPVWPFYEWLPKAHVEASTNFSIFLSGVLVKFAFFGFFKYLIIFGYDFNLSLLIPLLLVGLFDATLKVYYQVDLKKLVAYSTVIEMHWLLIALILGQSVLWVAVFSMLISHAIVSASFFFIVDMVTRRFKTRLISEVKSLFYTLPNLYLQALYWNLVILGFPGTLLFVSELLFFTFLLDTSFSIFLTIFLTTYLLASSFFFKNWFLTLFNYSYVLVTKLKFQTVDLEFKEFMILQALLALIFYLGLSLQYFAF